jgi:hypothetical protein
MSIVTGQGGACPPRRNEKKPRAGQMEEGIPGVKVLVAIKLITEIVRAIPRKSAVIWMVSARMACMIWLAMFGNGLTIGMTLPIIKLLPRRTPRDRPQGNSECCGAARGASSLAASVLSSAAGTTRRLRSATSAFVAPLHPRRGLTTVNHPRIYNEYMNERNLFVHSWRVLFVDGT